MKVKVIWCQITAWDWGLFVLTSLVDERAVKTGAVFVPLLYRVTRGCYMECVPGRDL